MLGGDDANVYVVVCNEETNAPIAEEDHEGNINPTIMLHALIGWTVLMTM